MDFSKLAKSHENNFEDFLFYDIEVFKENALVIFKNYDGETLYVLNTLEDFTRIESIISGKVLVGYNNYHYDDFILSSMIAGDDYQKIKQNNDRIIEEGYRPFSALNQNIFSLDCFQQLDASRPSLKKIEANLGLSIKESDIPFDIDRKLTEEEMLETIKYCETDIDATIVIFKLRWFDYFEPKLNILQQLPEWSRKYNLRRNVTRIIPEILLKDEYGNSLKYFQWHDFRLDKDLTNKRYDLLDKVPQEIVDIWTNGENGKYTHYDFDNTIVFSKGGLHGVKNNKKEFYDIKLLDVTSLYPNILININGLGRSTEKFKKLVETRIKAKREGNSVLANALKLFINSTYGILGEQYNPLFNPKALLSVCMFGQISLYDLCKRLNDAGYIIVNINTDGVAFHAGSDRPAKDFQKIKEEWEKDYNLNLELSEYEYLFQSNVNNYIAKTKDNYVKCVGGMVRQYYDPTDYLDDTLHLKSSPAWKTSKKLGILNLCIVNKLLYGRDPIDTVISNLDKPILFQYIVQAGNTYEGVYDEYGIKYQKVNRVFACKEDNPSKVTLKKKKPEGNLEYFPNAPMNMFVYNNDLRNFDNFEDIVDINYYVNLAEKQIQDFWSQ